MRHEDTPEINNPKIRFPVLEGDKLMKEVLNVRKVMQNKLQTKIINLQKKK